MRNDDHRITARSKKLGPPWYDARNREWQKYTCGVTAHGDCAFTLNKPTGRRR